MSRTTRPQPVAEDQPQIGSTPGPTPLAVARDQALEELQRCRTMCDGWEQQHAAASAELELLQAQVGEALLDDPDAAESVPRQVQGLRDRIYAAERAIEAAQLRVAAAESAYLTAEADLTELEIEQATAALETHEARTAELLALLEHHEGRFVLAARGGAGQFGDVVSIALPKSTTLRRAVTVARERLTILRDLAAGVDPHAGLLARISLIDGSVAGLQLADLYPPCVWGPEAVVSAPAYVREVATTAPLGDDQAPVDLEASDALDEHVSA